MSAFALRISDWLHGVVPFLILAALSAAPLRGEDAARAADGKEEFAAHLAKRQELQAKAAAVEPQRILMIVKHDDISVIFTAPFVAIPGEGDSTDEGSTRQTRRISIADTSCNQLLYGKDRNATTARSLLDDRLKQKIEFVDGLYQLTESQRKKLELAGRGDIHRFFEHAEELRLTLQDIDCDQAGDNRALAALVVEKSKPAKSLRRAVDSGLFEEDSLFAKSLKATLTPAQVAIDEQRDRGPQIDTAIARLRELGAFVREFHPRDNPEYWVQIISTGLGGATRKTAENFDDAALRDVEVIGRGVKLHLHLRHTSITSAGLARLASAGKIERIELTGRNVDEALLEILPKLPLQGLAIESDVLTDDDLRPLAACRQLTSVSLQGKLLTNDCLEFLIGLPKLEGVTLGNNFTAGAFAILARLPDLRDLDVSWQATPGLADFTRFPKLRKLSLSGREQDDDTALTIADSFKSLEQAYLRGTSITDEGVQHLSRLANLKTLTLDGAAIDDGVADSIRKMKHLEWLSFEGCAVGDATLAAVAECPEIRFLSLTNTHVTDDGLAELTKLKKLHVLYLSSCKFVTDEGVKSLGQLPASEKHNLLLNVQNSRITEQAARRLQEALPHAQIVWGVPAVPLK